MGYRQKHHTPQFGKRGNMRLSCGCVGGGVKHGPPVRTELCKLVLTKIRGLPGLFRMEGPILIHTPNPCMTQATGLADWTSPRSRGRSGTPQIEKGLQQGVVLPDSPASQCHFHLRGARDIRRLGSLGDKSDSCSQPCEQRGKMNLAQAKAKTTRC